MLNKQGNSPDKQKQNAFCKDFYGKMWIDFCLTQKHFSLQGFLVMTDGNKVIIYAKLL